MGHLPKDLVILCLGSLGFRNGKGSPVIFVQVSNDQVSVFRVTLFSVSPHGSSSHPGIRMSIPAATIMRPIRLVIERAFIAKIVSKYCGTFKFSLHVYILQIHSQ
jgi:hypothetical protein